MAKVKHLNGTSGLAHLGKVVEVRELTVGQWLALQRDLADADEQTKSFRMLANMLYVDDQPIGWDRLAALGLSEIAPAMDALNEMMGGAEGDEGNA